MSNRESGWTSRATWALALALLGALTGAAGQ